MLAPCVPPSHMLEAAFIVLALAILLGRYIATQARRDGGALPPGPRGLPLVGNLLGMPRVRPWYQFTQWAERYGESAMPACAV